MSEWEDVTLGTVCADGVIQTGPFGSQLHASDYRLSGVPVVMPQDLHGGRVSEASIARVSEQDAERLSRHRLRSGDIVYSRRGDVTRNALVGAREEGWLCGTGCLLVRPGGKTDSRWLAYWLMTPWTREWITRHAVGATMPNLNTSILAAVPVSLPRLDEQKGIAAVLGALDCLIDTDRALAESLEEHAASLFAAAGFDATPDSGCGIPLSDLLEINPRLAKPSGEAAYVDMAALPTDSSRVTSVARRPVSGGARFQNGDTLLARLTPCLENGKAALVDVLDQDEVAVGSTEFLVLRDRAGVGREWPYLLARSERFRDYAIQHMNGSSGRQRVSAESIGRYTVATPDPTRLEEFKRSAAIAFEAIRRLHDEIADLTRAREELLPLLMSGKVRVADLEGVT